MKIYCNTSYCVPLTAEVVDQFVLKPLWFRVLCKHKKYNTDYEIFIRVLEREGDDIQYMALPDVVDWVIDGSVPLLPEEYETIKHQFYGPGRSFHVDSIDYFNLCMPMEIYSEDEFKEMLAITKISGSPI